MALYPARIPGFTSHRNLLDDVDAQHINYIQDELTSLAQTVGPMPHVYNDLVADAGVVYPETGDTGGEDETTWTTDAKLANVTVKPRVHGNLSSRLDYIERGQQNHCFRFDAAAIDIRRGPSTLFDRPRGIRFPAPNAKRDPFRMYNGVGATIRKSGFWTFHAFVLWNMMGTAAENAGLFQGAIEIDGGFLESLDRYDHPANQAAFTFSLTRSGFYTAGQRISLRVSNASGAIQRVRTAVMSGFMVREDI